MTRILFLAFVLPTLLLLRAEDASVAGRIRKIEERWKPAQSLALYKVPGVSVAVIRDSKLDWAKAYGVKIAGDKHALDVATLFQAASISKSVAAVAAMHMVQFGNFTLDENVNSKLTAWQVKDNPFTVDAKVTLRGLLSHSAGLTVHGFGGYEKGKPLPVITQILNGEKPANSPPVVVDIVPGTRWRYSGGGYTVVQLMMQERLKKSFADIMQMIVLGKLEMRDSTYAQPLPRALHSRASFGHDKNGRAIKGDWHTYPEQAAAGLWTTPSDLARFLIEIQKSARGESNKVIEKKTALDMLTLQKGAYGLGFSLKPEHGGFGHNGSNEGFKCYMHANGRDGIVIMTNGDLGFKVIEEIVSAIESEYGWKNFKP